MSWQKNAEVAAASAYRITYADAIAEGLDESEARELAEDAAQDAWYAAGGHDDAYDAQA